MPTYEYRCQSCADQFEIVQSFKDASLNVCKKCSGELRKVYGNVGISFKGSGFYKNDARTGSSAGASAGGSSDSTASGAAAGAAPSSGDASSSGSSGSSGSAGSSSSSSDGGSTGGSSHGASTTTPAAASPAK